MASTAKTPAPAAPAGITFEAPVSVPAVTREPKANPFKDVATDLAANRDKALPFVVANADVAYNVRMAQNAGKDAGVTIRNKREAVGDTQTRITIWAVDAIKRPRTA